MEAFIEEILADIDWRVSELATIKTIPTKYSFRDDHKKLHLKYSVTAIYSVWEGYIKNTFTLYSNHLNTLSISRYQISTSLLTHKLDSECNFNNPRTAFKSKKKLVKLIENIFEDTITLKPIIPTESNVNFKVLNKILERFSIKSVSISYENGLNKLLQFRNMIAHGENALSVNITHVTEFISLIEQLMLDIVINIEYCYKIKTYLK